MPHTAADPLIPLAPEEFGPSQAAALLRRAGFGGTPEQASALAATGLHNAVDLMVNYERVEDPRPVGADLFDASIVREPTEADRRAAMQARARRDEDALARLRMEREAMERADRAQAGAVRRWWLERMIDTPRPLEEKMTLFWHGHFATSQRKVENSYHLFLQNRAFRAHALGRFDDLLRAMIRDPAMLAWLDNRASRAESPNENLAREVMELFALGPGEYTEQDIREGARALTGYTFEGNGFVFRREWHDPNPKTIFGVRGRHTGDDFVDLIVARTVCARFLAQKLHRFFVDADGPERFEDAPADTRAVVARMATDIGRAKHDLKPALTRLFLSRHFYDACARSTHIKSPIELVVGAIRSLRTPARGPRVLLDALGQMGQSPLFPPTVAGWPGGRAWINTATLLARQNALVYLLTGGVGDGARPARARDYDPLVALPALRHASTPRALAAVACRDTLGVESSAAVENLTRWCAARFGAAPDEPLPRRLDADDAVALLIALAALPEFQLC